MQPQSEQQQILSAAAALSDEQELDDFFSHTYHDMRFFLNCLTESNNSTFTYFGDAQKDLYYISNNMRDTFGFEHNTVPHMLDLWKDRICGRKWRLMYVEDCKQVMKDPNHTHDLRYQVMDKDGNVFWIRCYGSMKWDQSKKKPLFFAGRITRQDDQFAVDPITSFPLESTLQLRLSKLQKAGLHTLAIGFSLNNVTQINTMHGRSTGDQLIRIVSANLIDSLIGKMNFYRLSGIRCLALVDQGVTESREELISQIRAIVDSGYDQMGLVVDRPCSFAVMEFPQPDLNPEDFVENMTALIKLACEDPKQPYVEDSRANIDRIREMSNIQMELTRNVLGGMKNFRVVVQPVVSARTGRIISGEVLLRWRYHSRDISPAVFIPILERDRMIHVAGRWVMEQAIRASAAIRQWIPDIYLSVNVSLEQLYDEELLEYIPQLLKKYDLEGRHLVIEMTESSMDREPGKLRSLIDVCHGLGVRLALDDFGTGYSSLRVLLQYNTNVIKLDRSLLLEMTKSQDKSNFISSIVFACHQFGKKVCMEGVETETQRKLVADACCDMIQGFYYYRPTELERVYEIAREQSALPPAPSEEELALTCPF